MKTLFKLLSILGVALLMLTSCEGPMGPFGQDGADGKDGTNGLDGKDGKDVKELCLTCHSTANTLAKESQFEISDKGERGARTSKYCAKCHTTEGFHETVKMGTFYPSNEMLNGTKHGCTTCHAHSTFEFSGDTVSQTLLTTAPVYSAFNNFSTAWLTSTSSSAAPFTQVNEADYGSINNLCANCHTYRGSRSGMLYTDVASNLTNKKFNDFPYWPIVNGNETTDVNYMVGRNIEIHEGANQPDYLKGLNGYEYTGKTYTKTTTHSGYTCTQCHFNAYDATNKTGGHTMIVNKADPSCTGCHNIADKRTTTLTSINAKLAELGDLLAARKVFKKSSSTSSSALNGFTYSPLESHDFYGTLLPTTASATTYALGASRKTKVSLTTGLLEYYVDVTWSVDAAATTRLGRPWKYGELGAAWNFTYVNTTASAANRAVHNPKYAMELLQTSIDWLTANP